MCDTIHFQSLALRASFAPVDVFVGLFLDMLLNTFNNMFMSMSADLFAGVIDALGCDHLQPCLCFDHLGFACLPFDPHAPVWVLHVFISANDIVHLGARWPIARRYEYVALV